MRLDAEGEVAQHLRPQPVAQAHILESDQSLQIPAVFAAICSGPGPARAWRMPHKAAGIRPLWFPIR